MSVDIGFLGLIPVLLIALFFYLVCRVCWTVLRGFGRLLGAGGRARLAGNSEGMEVGRRRARAARRGPRICANPRCRRANVAIANYCAQCGQRL